MAGLKEIHEWWEIPSIVHLCNTLSSCCKDISPLSIENFEYGLVNNNKMLMNMAIRFVKVCGFYESTSDKWWDFMKTLFKNHCSVYGFEDPLGTAICFDDLLPKKKVETLYILSHFVLDVEDLQEKLKNKPEILSRLNVKPLGYDLNKSVYWYFGGTRLYREDFDNFEDLSADVLELLNPEQNESISTTVINESKITISCVNNNFEDTEQPDHSHLQKKVQRVFQNDPYPSSILGPGKWKLICDDEESWQFLSDKTRYSRNINIKMLHKCVCKIIDNYSLKKNKQPKYHYIPYSSQILKRLRSFDVNLESLHRITSKRLKKDHTNDVFKCEPAKDENIMTTNLQVDLKPVVVLVDINKKTRSSNRLVNKGMVQLQEAVNNQSSISSVQTNFSSPLKIIANTPNTKLSKLQYTDTNQRLQRSSNNKPNVGPDLIKVRQDCLQRVVRVNIERYDQENMHNTNYTVSNNHKRLRTSTRLKTETKHIPLNNLSCYVSN